MPTFVVGVAVGTDIPILIDVLSMEEVDASEDDEEGKAVFADEVEEDDVVEGVVALDEVDDAFDVDELDGTLKVVETLGPSQSLGAVSAATRLNGSFVSNEFASLTRSR